MVQLSGRADDHGVIFYITWDGYQVMPILLHKTYFKRMHDSIS